MKPKFHDLPDQRPIPDAALRDAHACELIRIWVAENGLHCSLRANGPKGTTDEIDWGVVLAAAVRHVARALCGDEGEVEESVARIANAFNSELADPVTEVAAAPTASRPTLH